MVFNLLFGNQIRAIEVEERILDWTLSTTNGKQKIRHAGSCSFHIFHYMLGPNSELIQYSILTVLLLERVIEWIYCTEKNISSKIIF